MLPRESESQNLSLILYNHSGSEHRRTFRGTIHVFFFGYAHQFGNESSALQKEVLHY